MFKRFFYGLFVFFLSIPAFSQTTFQKQLILEGGAQYFHNWCLSRAYPEVGLEFKVSKLSAFETQLTYQKLPKSYGPYSTLRWSTGYKLNLVPIITNNEKICSKLGFYASPRYVLSMSYHKTFKDPYFMHDLTFAPGIDYYFNEHWGINAERSFWVTSSARPLWAFRLKYRL
jgi:hypothetical protein